MTSFSVAAARWMRRIHRRVRPGLRQALAIPAQRGHTVPDATIVQRLDAVILKALGYSYTATSCKDGIATGNRYQSVTLGTTRIEGFRTGREYVFDLFDWRGKQVLDIGSNLGEMARQALARGALHAHGVEYDPFFALLSDLISIRNGIDPARFEFEQNDFTEKFQFTRTYDAIMAFSVFTYIHGRLDEIAEATREFLIVETHKAGADWEAQYVAPLRERFPLVVAIGESDWSVSPEHSEGRRMLLVCFKDAGFAWSMFDRIASIAPPTSTRMTVDLQKSSIPAFERLKDFLRNDSLSSLDDLPSDDSLATIRGRLEPASLSDALYWLEYYRGYRHYRRSGFLVSEDNPYLRLMRSMISAGSNFDPGAMLQMADGPGLRDRVERRLADYRATDDTKSDAPVPAAILFDVAGGRPAIRIVSTEGSESTGTQLDGYHRLAAALLTGRRVVPMYHLRVFGEL